MRKYARPNGPPALRPLRTWLNDQWLSLTLVGTALLCLGLSGSLVFFSIPEAKREAQVNRDLQAEMSQVQILVAGEANDERGYLLTGDVTFLAEFADKQRQVAAQLGSARAHASAEVINLLENGLSAYRSFLSSHVEVTASFQGGDRRQATALALGPARADRKASQAAFAAAVDVAEREASAEAAREAELTTVSGAALIFVGFVLLLVAVEVARRVRTQHRSSALLRDSEHFRTLVDHLPAAVYAVDPAGVVLAWNRAASAMFGWNEAETVGQLLPFVSVEQQGAFAQLLREVAAGRQMDGLETTQQRRDGTPITVSVTTAPMRSNRGEVVATIGITVDVTEQRRVEAELERHRQSDRLLAAIVTASADAIIGISMDGTMVSWNAGAEEMFGYQASEVIGQSATILARRQDLMETRALLERVVTGHLVLGQEGIRVRKGGDEFPVAVTVSPVYAADECVVGVSAVLRDISDQKALEAALERRALHDDLTGLPNRALFIDRLALVLARSHRHPGTVAVLSVDIDQFKVINDSLGHSQGDRLLALMGERLTAAVRPGDTVGRLGGDEFVVLCEGLVGESEAVGIGDLSARWPPPPSSLRVSTTSSRSAQGLR